MAGMAETLTTRMGPLPVWAWTGLGIGGLGLYLYHQRTKDAQAQADQANADNQGLSSSNLGTVPISNLTTAAQPMPIQMGDTFVDVQSPDVTTNVTDNDPDPTKTPIPTPPGKPPPPKPPITTPKPPAKKLPTPAKPPPPKAATQRTTTVCAWPQWCGSLWGIAQHYYGNGADWPKIYNANKGKIGSNPNLIHPGTVLVIP